MKTKSFLSLVLLSAIVVSCLGVSTKAAEYQGGVITYAVDATGSFRAAYFELAAAGAFEA